jgi:hypothetical protein
MSHTIKKCMVGPCMSLDLLLKRKEKCCGKKSLLRSSCCKEALKNSLPRPSSLQKFYEHVEYYTFSNNVEVRVRMHYWEREGSKEF